MNNLPTIGPIEIVAILLIVSLVVFMVRWLRSRVVSVNFCKNWWLARKRGPSSSKMVGV